MAFGKPAADGIIHAFDLKISTRFASDFVATLPQVADQFVVIDGLDVFPRPQHFVILQRLPFLFGFIKRGVEDDAMRVQVGIKRAGGIMGEQAGHHIAGEPCIIGLVFANASRGEGFKFFERDLNGTLMGGNDSFVIRQQRHH